MAAKLQCEICGGKLIGKPGGIFECENCGTEYSTEWAKAKIQEITGTVKVEGTVEVTGKVQVDGLVQVDITANKEALLRLGELALEGRKWDEATDFYDKVLNLEPENAMAYLGKLLAKHNCTSIKGLETAKWLFDTDRDYQNALRFADYALKKQLQDSVEAYNERKRKELFEKEERTKKLSEIRGKYRIPNTMIAVGYCHTVGLRSDGTVVAVGGNSDGQCDVSNWTDIVAVAAGSSHTVGLKADGTVVAVGDNHDGQCNVGDWTRIVAVEAGNWHTIGVRANGTVVAAGCNSKGQCDVSNWTDIVSVSTPKESVIPRTLGRRADGTWVSTKIPWDFGDKWFETVMANDYDTVSFFSSMEIRLKADGSLYGSYRRDGMFKLLDFQNSQGFVAVTGGKDYCVALRPNGKVVAAGENRYGQCNVSAWNSIVAVAAGGERTVGIKADGTVAAVGKNTDGQCDVSEWKLFNSVDTIEAERETAQQEKAEAARKAAAEKVDAWRKAKIEALNKEKVEKEARKAALERELPTLTGFFKAGKKQGVEMELTKIEARLAQIKSELIQLGEY